LLRQHDQGAWRDVAAECRTLLEQRIAFEASANAGVVHLYEGRPDQGVRDLQRAVVLAPEHVGAHLNLALALLATGDWTRGFAEYEWRLRSEHAHASHRPYPQPRWHGELLKGKTIFVYAEQGFGDAIQFVRYASVLRDRGARVVVECRRELVRLFRCVAGIDAVITRGEAPPPFDVHLPMLSIPGIVGTVPQTVPADVPYVIVPMELRAERPAVLVGVPPGPVVGVVCSGNSASSIDRERSLSWDEMLAALPAGGVTYVPLDAGQGSGPVKRKADAHHIIDTSAAIRDFMDTAHIISHCDVVVSVDTAAAHLAGALGARVITLIPVHADWRWLMRGETTPWYPTMKLRRQKQRGVWDDVLQAVAQDIQRIREHHDHQ
jgi:hypothetical protein